MAHARVRRFDLHLHSTRSDGAFAPEEVLRRCAARGLDVVALTDHDLVGSAAPGVHTIDGRELQVIAGAELSGTHDGHEYHLLVYFPGEIPEAFSAFCRQRVAARAVRYRDALRSLNLAGLTEPGPDAENGERSLTRHHLARALVAAGHATDVRDAFRRFAGDGKGHVQPVDLTFLEAIRTARAHGGLTSWAHPPLPALERYLPAFVAAGLQGLEGLRPLMSSEDRRRVRKQAERHGLVITGGSDWHGWGDGEPGLFFVEEVQLKPFLSALHAPVAG